MSIFLIQGHTVSIVGERKKTLPSRVALEGPYELKINCIDVYDG